MEALQVGWEAWSGLHALVNAPVILEEDRIVVLEDDAARRFWRQWWEEEAGTIKKR